MLNDYSFWKTVDIKKSLFNCFLVIIGSLILAFGFAIFLTKFNIVSGGLSGIALIIQNYFPDFQVIDIVTGIGSVILWIFGFFAVGKRFAMKSLIASISFPLFLSLFLRVPVFIDLANTVAKDASTGNILLCGIFGGIFTGAGMSVCFIGGGSSGGTDSLVIAAEKYLHIKSSVVSFVLDGIIILLSMFLIKDNVVNSLCGIITALVTALIIEFLYEGFVSGYQMDIISDKWEEISRYVQDELGRGSTIIPIKGGYKQEDKIMLRIVFDKTQFYLIRKHIAKVDPKAFITYSKISTVYGEGFKDISSKKKH